MYEDESCFVVTFIANLDRSNILGKFSVPV